MKRSLVVFLIASLSISLLPATSALARKKKKKEVLPPPSVEISGTVQSIKDLIVRALVNQGYTTASDSNYSLIMEKPERLTGGRAALAGALLGYDPSRPPSDFSIFDLSPMGGKVLVKMAEQVSIKRPLGLTDTYPLTDPKEQKQMQAFLDDLKVAIETSSSVDPKSGYFGLWIDDNLKIHWVSDHSPSQEAGLRIGDTIIAFDGKAAVSFNQLSDAMNRTKPGDSTKITVLRGGDTKTFTVIAAKRPEVKQSIEASSRIDPKSGYFGFKTDADLKVSSFADHSPSEDAGLRIGDQIIAFNGMATASMDQLTDAVRSTKPGDAVKITVLRDGDAKTFTVIAAKRSGT